jgi:hypothetical protein
MRYLDPSIIYKNALASFFVREFQINSLFDPDPLIGGGSVSGYSDLVNLYNRNIVTHVRLSVDMVNIEPGTVVGAYLIFRDVQPSTVILSQLDAISSAEVAPATRVKMMGTVSGQPRCRLRARIPLATIIGRPLEYLTDISYAASANSNPPQLLWAAIVLFTYTPLTLLVNGVAVAATLDFRTNWYSGQKALDYTNPRLQARQRHLQEINSPPDDDLSLLQPEPILHPSFPAHKQGRLPLRK